MVISGTFARKHAAVSVQRPQPKPLEEAGRWSFQTDRMDRRRVSSDR